MVERVRLLLALSAQTWEEAMQYCPEGKYPEKLSKGYINDMIDRALRD